MSSAPPAQTNEAGGLQGTAQNLGASLGTALIGAVLLIGLTEGFAATDRGRPGAPRRHAGRRSRTRLATTGLEVVTVDQRRRRNRDDAGLPPDQVAAVTAAYGDAAAPGSAAGPGRRGAVLVLWARGSPGGCRPGRARWWIPADDRGRQRYRPPPDRESRRRDRASPTRRRVARLGIDGSARHRATRVASRAGGGRCGARAGRVRLGRRDARCADRWPCRVAAATRLGPGARSCCRRSTRSSRGSAGSASRRSTTSAGGWRSPRPRRTAWPRSTRSSRRRRGRRSWSTSATTSPVAWPARNGSATTWRAAWRRPASRSKTDARPGSAARASGCATGHPRRWSPGPARRRARPSSHRSMRSA